MAVVDLTSEMSRLMDEVDAEFDALLADDSDSASSYSDPDQHSAGQTAPSPVPWNALELSAASPRPATHDSSSPPSGPPSTSAPGSTALSLPSMSGLRPPAASTPSLLALPTLVQSPAAVAGAGGRAQRRRQNWQRANSAAGAGAGPKSEAKYKASGTNSLSGLLGSFSKDRILSAEDEAQLVAAATDYMQLKRVGQVLARVLRRDPSIAEVAESMGCAESALAARMEIGSQARAILAQRNYRLVVHIAKNILRYMTASGGGRNGGVVGRGMGAGSYGGLSASNPVLMEDTIAAGMEGLMAALQKFRPDAGCRLSTYATWWIRQHVIKFVRRQQAVVTLPLTARALVERMVRTRRELSASLHRVPTDEEVAEAMDIKAAKVQELEELRRGAMAAVKSFEAPVSERDEGANTNADTVAPGADDEDMLTGTGSALSVDSEEHYALDVELTATVDDVLSSLDQRDEDVLRRAYGLADPIEDGSAAATGAVTVGGVGVRLGSATARGRGGSGGDGAARDPLAGEEEEKQEQQQQQEGRKKLARRRLEISQPNPSQHAALKRLRARGAQDKRLADWASAPVSKAEAPARSVGYAKKSS